MKWNSAHWRRKVAAFQKFIEPLVADIGRSERRESAALYVQGLLMPGQRKSIEPIAQRLRVDSQKLQQFLSDSPWQERHVWRAIRREVIPAMEPLQAWVVDETGWLKQGNHSVGVSHQYCGAVGKQAQCQVAVELVVSDGEIAAPVGGRLYLPEVWTRDRSRRRGAGVPEQVTFQTKPDIAGDLIEEALADGLTAAPVLGDSVYGRAPELRRRLRGLGMEYFFQGEEHWLAWAQRPKLTHGYKLWRVAKTAPKAQSLRQWAESFKSPGMAGGGLGGGRRRKARHPPGVEADLSAQRFGGTKRRVAILLAGGGLARRRARSLSCLCCLAPAASDQGAEPAFKPRPLAHRTVFSTGQRRLGLGPL